MSTPAACHNITSKLRLDRALRYHARPGERFRVTFDILEDELGLGIVLRDDNDTTIVLAQDHPAIAALLALDDEYASAGALYAVAVEVFCQSVRRPAD